jgi:hypothetical protein
MHFFFEWPRENHFQCCLVHPIQPRISSAGVTGRLYPEVTSYGEKTRTKTETGLQKKCTAQYTVSYPKHSQILSKIWVFIAENHLEVRSAKAIRIRWLQEMLKSCNVWKRAENGRNKAVFA